MDNNDNECVHKSNERAHRLIIALLLITAIVLGLNTLNLSQASAIGDSFTGNVVAAQQRSSAPDIIPTGTPAIYGEELDIRFDDVSPSDQRTADAAIRTLANLDKSITLSGSEKERYINTLYRLHDGISCEYCCGARSIIFENGEPACGCAHSYAMRGLAKYLLTEHGDEYTDEEILEELGKWKTLFFPGQMQVKSAVLEQQGVEFNYINLASNRYRGAEKGVSASGGMVGGC